MLPIWPAASCVASGRPVSRHGDVRRDDRHGLGGDHRRVDGVLRRLAAEDGQHLLGDVDGDALLGLRRRGAEVRRDDDLVVVEHGCGHVRRLLREDVDGRAGDRPPSTAATSASMSIRSPRAVLISRADGRIWPAPPSPMRWRVCAVSTVCSDTKSARRQELVKRGRQLDAEHGGALRRDEGVIRDDRHVESLAAARHL